MVRTPRKVFIALQAHVNTNSEMTQGILDYARLHGPWLTRIMGIDDEFSTTHFKTDDLDGAIVEDMPTSRCLLRKLHDIPTITSLNERYSVFDTNPRQLRIHCDNETVAQTAADYLLSKRPSELAFIGAPGNPPWSQSREETFCRLIEDSGHHCHVWRSKHNPRFDTFSKALGLWLEKLPVGTAVFAANDPTARHVLNLCLEYKIAVPERLSLLGVDNNPLLCDTATPTLSSISLTTREAGFEAARMLEQMMNGFVPPPGFEIRYTAQRIVERDSTASEKSLGNSFVNRFSRFITIRLLDGLGRLLTIDDAVNAAGISRRSAEAIIKRETGRTLHDEMIRLKLKFALDMISNGQDTLDMIASKCGFANASHLCRLFREYYGKTPSSYRRTPTCKTQ